VVTKRSAYMNAAEVEIDRLQRDNEALTDELRIVRGVLNEKVDVVERLQRENGALARMYAVCEETLRERTEQLTVTHQALRDALQEQRRLQTADRQWADKVRSLVTERDRFKESNTALLREVTETLPTVMAERDMWWEHHENLRVEYQELLAQANRTAGIYEKEIERLRVDNVRLAECWTAEQQEVQRLVAVLDEIERGSRSLDYATHLARVAVVPPTDEGLEQSQGLMPSA
jgi:chromosome segregation ATPase